MEALQTGEWAERHKQPMLRQLESRLVICVPKHQGLLTTRTTITPFLSKAALDVHTMSRPNSLTTPTEDRSGAEPLA